MPDIQTMIEQDQKSLTRKGARFCIWSDDFESDAEAIQAFMNLAAECMDFDYQFSQSTRRYFLRKYGIKPQIQE